MNTTFTPIFSSIKLGLLFQIMLISFSLNAQKQDILFEDGSVIAVDFQSTDPDQARKLSIYAGGFGPEALHLFGASYYIPKKSLIDVRVGTIEDESAYHAYASVFFKNTEKDAVLKLSVKRQYLGNRTELRHVVTKPIQKRRSYGVRFGLGSIEYPIDLRAQHVVLGLTMLSAKHSSWLIPSRRKKPLQGTSIGSLHIEGAYYFNPQAIGGFKNNDDVAEELRTLGGRIYYEKAVTLWGGSGHFGFRYMIGLIVSGDARTGMVGPVGLTGGLGINYMLF